MRWRRRLIKLGCTFRLAVDDCGKLNDLLWFGVIVGINVDNDDDDDADDDAEDDADDTAHNDADDDVRKNDDEYGFITQFKPDGGEVVADDHTDVSAGICTWCAVKGFTKRSLCCSRLNKLKVLSFGRILGEMDERNEKRFKDSSMSDWVTTVLVGSSAARNIASSISRMFHSFMVSVPEGVVGRCAILTEVLLL